MIPKPDERGRGWRSWRLGGGVALRITQWGGGIVGHTLDLPIKDRIVGWCTLISREQAAAVLAALGREMSQPK
jgi:hypothetical protein